MDLPSSHRRSRHSPGFSGVYPGNCLWLASLPSLSLCLECKPSVLGSTCWKMSMVGTCVPNACSFVDPGLGVIIGWLRWGKGPGRKVQFSFFSDMQMCCHWLLLGSSKPVMEKRFYWQNTFYIHMHACLHFGRLRKCVAPVFPTPLSIWDLTNSPRPSSVLAPYMQFFLTTPVHTDLSTISAVVAIIIFPSQGRCTTE